mgnify:CR=1 FL=1
MDINNNHNQSVSSLHLQQQELVSFLYRRVGVGILITLFISAIASLVAYIELDIQGKQYWVLAWFTIMLLISVVRLRLRGQFRKASNKAYFPYQTWHNRFFIGVLASGAMQGVGAALLMPHVTTNLQIILHSLLLGMGAGAIAYLSTSLRIYIAYLVSIMSPVTLWLLLQQTPDAYVLSFLYVFFMFAGSISVKRMNELVNDALYFRFDNETLVSDLQRLLESVSQSNKALEKVSTTDELTGISNYRAFRVRLEEIWRQHRGSNVQVSLIKINVDYYHEFNAHYGQQAGDRYLREIAGMLSAEISDKSHLAARLDGAEFALLLPACSSEVAREIARRIGDGLAQKKVEHAKSRASDYLTLSMGLGSQLVGFNSSSRDLLLRADTALKLAKEKGRNRLETIEV